MTAQSHNESRGHDMSAMLTANERALKISAALTGVYFFVEVALGIASGSIAVLSDAFHTFSAVGGVLLALVAGRIAARPSDRHRTFGSFRAELIGALLNGLFLFLMALFVIFMGVRRMFQPVELQYGLMLAAAAGGIFTELISLAVLMKGSRENLNMRGAFWHVMQTFVGSLIIIVAAVVVYFTGFTLIDPILGTAFGLVLIWASWGITRDALRLLLETVPSDVDLDAVERALSAVENVETLHHIHAWALTSGRNLFSAHIGIKDGADAEIVRRAADIILRKNFKFYFTTLQVETSSSHSDPAIEINYLWNQAGDAKQ
ncbi:MAG: cation diffusion facilitator family transporter [Litorimonas sp.]